MGGTWKRVISFVTSFGSFFCSAGGVFRTLHVVFSLYFLRGESRKTSKNSLVTHLSGLTIVRFNLVQSPDNFSKEVLL